MRRRTIVCLLLTLGTSPLAAQDAPAPRTLCFRGQRADACRWFFITESRYHFLLAGSRESWSDAGSAITRPYLVAEGGLMRNISPTTAVGMTLWGGYDFGYETTRLGISARARRWLSPQRSIEGALGPLYTSRWQAGGGSTLGAGGRVGLNFGDRVSLGLRIEWVPEGGRCPTQFASPEGCYEYVPDPGSGGMTGVVVDRTVPVRVWRVYAAAGVGSKPGLYSWLAAGSLGLLALLMSDCCSGGGWGWGGN